MRMILKTIAVAAVSATVPLWAAAPLAAQTMRNEGLPPSDPIMQMAEDDAPRNEFFLNNQQDVELIRFKRVHDIEICAGRPDPDAIGSAKHGYAITVSWDSDVGLIMPGNCLTFDAMRVKVKPASALPQSIELVGTVKVLH